MKEIRRYCKRPGISTGRLMAVMNKIKDVIPHHIVELETELCFNVEIQNGYLQDPDETRLKWILSDCFNEDKLLTESWFFKDEKEEGVSTVLFEIGPRLNFSTAWSTNAVSVCQSIGLTQITRIEESVRYLLRTKNGGDGNLTNEEEQAILSKIHDRMTECRYNEPLKSFDVKVKPEDCQEIDILVEGKTAMENINKSLGLAFDDWDIDYYTQLFKDKLHRNPTSVECFDLAQSNSEHSRHWFFRGKMILDGKEMPESLMKMVMTTQKSTNPNNVIKFCDNSSAIEGYKVKVIRPLNTADPSSFILDSERQRHVTFTAETHNFPTGVAPFPGATTGTGGRIRDNHATGTGAHVVAGTAGYCFGNLHIPGYDLPWEKSSDYPSNFAAPLEVAIEASNGASDYGNKFGEPVIAGFARSFGLKLPNGERREWIKPIMFSGGMGSMEAEHINKRHPEIGMKVVKIGGPVYRIGVGGGAASSVQVQGDNAEDLDFGAVQRGDAEMEQKLNRAIRACIEMGENNPICSIHDQGAGGNGNVLKEIVEPAGAVINVKDFELGDPTLSVMEVWGAEYQESDAILIEPKDVSLLKKIGKREKVPVCFVGTVTGDGRIVLKDECLKEYEASEEEEKAANKKRKFQNPVDLPLDIVLGKMPPKVFMLDRIKPNLTSLTFPDSLTVPDALDRVLRLPSVASKRYLTNKVDRCVTGLIAQQQCVGPLHTPVADVAVTALSYFDTVGAATAIGEQPIKGLIDPGCGARMTIGEALTNLVFAKISDLKDVKCSGNWMWAAKLPGEGANLYDACKAMCETMSELGIAVDGGKDSLSMAARVGEEIVKAPGELVISVYAPCEDITKTVTPDLKCPDGKGVLIYVNFSDGVYRLGGSALAQVFSQIGKESPDLDNAKMFVHGFGATQKLISERLLRSGHDISDGGIITTLLEMAFSGNCGIVVDIPSGKHSDSKDLAILNVLFSEELGFVLEVAESDAEYVIKCYKDANVPCHRIGYSYCQDQTANIFISVDGEKVVEDRMVDMRDTWEATSFQLERLQTNPKCVAEEENGIRLRKRPEYSLSFQPESPKLLSARTECVNGDLEHSSGKDAKPKVAVIREEGSNGDREMAASLFLAGFDVWDVTMEDICSNSVKFDDFRGIVFVGGFSFADVFGSAKGWAAVSLFNENANKEFEMFYKRHDTFSLGVCNGCQLMGLLGWVGSDYQKSVGARFGNEKLTTDGDSERTLSMQGVCFTHNTSERFECRFVTVKIEESPAMMLQGMEGSTLGIWVAHGEGRALFANEEAHQHVLSHNLAPIRYVDDDGKVTCSYPLNPNGSPDAIAGLCSADGRHLAMMPHPERCTLLWQWPWMPEEWKGLKASPWLRMFQNAYNWCSESQK